MGRLAPSTYKPHLSFRFKIQFSDLPNIQFYGKASTLPEVSNNPLSVEYGNTYMMVKGKTRWSEVTITCYAYENMTHTELWNYLNRMHQDVGLGTDMYPDDYKKDIYIYLLNPQDRPVCAWRLIGAFMSGLRNGTADWASEEIIQPEITIAYDYAQYIEQA